MSERETKTPAKAKILVACVACGSAGKTKMGDGSPITPRRWKSRTDAGAKIFYCPACWQRLYVLRCIQLPVQGVHEGGSWKEFVTAVRQCLLRSRTLAQWGVNLLFASDVTRRFSDDKMPPHPPLGHAKNVYLYGVAKDQYPDWKEWQGSCRAAGDVLRRVELTYNAKRYDVVWKGAAAVPTVRSCPYPIDSQNWKPSMVDGGDNGAGQVPAVKLPLGGQQWLLRLRGGRSRQRQMFLQLVSGAAVTSSLSVLMRRSNPSRHRNGMEATSRGAKRWNDIVLKLVGWFPREERAANRVGVLHVRSSQKAFLVASFTGLDRPWVLNRDDWRRKIARHARFLQRVADDTKAEVRKFVPANEPWRKLSPEERKEHRRRKRSRLHRLARLEEAARHYHNFTDTAIKTAAKWLVNFALRCRVETLELDLKETSYSRGFGMAALGSRIVQLAGEQTPPINITWKQNAHSEGMSDEPEDSED